MANKYLISAMVDGVENFYTANPDGTLINIGTSINWDSGFDEYTLSCINNSVYSTLKDGKVWVNNNATTAVEDSASDGGYVYSTNQTAIDCTGYSGLTSLTVGFNGTEKTDKDKVKIALSFNNKQSYYTRGTGYVAATTAAIPTTAASRTTSKVVIDEETFAPLFDGSASTMVSVDEPSLIVPVEFRNGNGLVARKYTINIPQSCRLPLITKLQAYDSEAEEWKTLDTITIKASKVLTRYFENELETISYRWVFETDPTDLGDDPTRNIDINELNIYGRTTGNVWLPMNNVANVKEQGMSITALEALTSADFTQIFQNTQIDFVLYIPNTTTYNVTSITAKFPANGSPVIDYFRALSNKIHAGNVDVIFKFSDPEKGNVNYRLFVNEELVIAKYNAESDKDIRETIPNSAFRKIDETDTKEVEATNTIRLEVEDEYGATSSETYIVTKIDRLPTMIGVLDPDTYRYTFSIQDADSDKVKYSAYLNDSDTPFTSSQLMNVPTGELYFDIPQNHIKIGKTNTLKIVVTDAVLGEITVLVNFEGTYPSLLFIDEKDEILSNNFGDVLKKLDLGTMCCGQVSVPVKVTILNNTTKAVKDLLILSPKDINGEDIPIKDGNGVVVENRHIDGTLWIQLSFDENFTDPNSYYTLNIPLLGSHERKVFYIRAHSTSSLAKPDVYENIKINATSSVVNSIQ